MEISMLNSGHLSAFKIYAEECNSDGLDLYPLQENDCADYLKKQIAYSEGKELPIGWLPTSTFFCIESGVILGSIRIRHGTNDYITDVIGHIGYETLPIARGRGVATYMLEWVRNNVLEDTNIIICDLDNIASQKVIIKSKGEYLKQYYSQEEDVEVVSYRLHPA
jgi:predicted acetyltransferase